MAAKAQRKQSPTADDTAPAKPAPTETAWLTRVQAAKRLGLSISGLRQRVRNGGVTEARSADGRPLYDAKQIDQLARRKPAKHAEDDLASSPDGRLAAKAFKLFEEKGINLRLAVTQLQIPLDVADDLARDFARAAGEVVFLLRPETLERLRAACAWRGTDEASLAEAVERQLAEYMQARDTRADAANRDADAARREAEGLRTKLTEVEAASKRLREDLASEQEVSLALRQKLETKRAEIERLTAGVKPPAAAAAEPKAPSAPAPDAKSSGT